MLGAGPAQSTPPAAGLVAEGESRWTEALQIYRDQVRQNPGDAALWTRIAEIEARLGQPQLAIAALESAAAAAPSDPAAFSRLSQAYAVQGQALAAFRAIEGALALDPRSDSFLRAHATLATWAGQYAAAADSYRRLEQAHPTEIDLTLALARVNAWRGASDQAVVAYREYVDAAGAVPEALIELARTESWRGNFAAAIAALDRYLTQYGETDAYTRERISVLARGGRPRQALDNLDAFEKISGSGPDLALSRTIALAALGHQGAAATSLDSARSLRHNTADTASAESVVRSLLGSTLGPSTTFYNDSDSLQTSTSTARFDFGFQTDTRIQGGYEHTYLRARAGSGLEQTSGVETAAEESGSAGLTQRLGNWTFAGSLGQARAEGHRFTTYATSVRFAPSDSLIASVDRSSGLAVISPRMAGLGLTRVGERAQVDWTPGLRYRLVFDGAYENLSDGNSRWNLFVSPRVAVARTQNWNLDLGVSLHQLGARLNLDNGYYDPHRYEDYSIVFSPYWKASENIGVGAAAAVGAQRDDNSRSFRPGGNGSMEATFGIYRQWLLKAYGSVTNNSRLDSGAFRGVAGGVTLLRRF